MNTLSDVVGKIVTQRELKEQKIGMESVLTGGVGQVTNDIGKSIDKTKKTFKNLFGDEMSLSEYTRAANLEPRVMVEETLRNLPNLANFLSTLTNLYSAYYLQAVSLTAKIGGVEVIKKLDKFNPNRKYGSIAAIGVEEAANSMYQYGYKLPNYKTLSYKDKINVSNEDSSSKGDISVNVTNSLKDIKDLDNLAVGKLLSVNLSEGNERISIPVAVRMRPMSVPQLIMRELLTFGDIKESWKERWHRMRSGELSFWKDWVFQSDVIKNRKKLLALDKQGLYKEMLKRRQDNRLSQIASGQASIGAASAFIITTERTVKEVESRIGQSIHNEIFRNKVFAENSAMMIIVIDEDWERIVAYTRGIPGAAEYTFKQFESLGKGNGPDILEIMKAYTLSSKPTF